MFSPTTGRVASTTGLDFSVSMRLPLGRSPGNAHRLAAEPLASSRSAHHGGQSTRTSGRDLSGQRTQGGSADLPTYGGGALHERPGSAVVHGRRPVARATISVV